MVLCYWIHQSNVVKRTLSFAFNLLMCLASIKRIDVGILKWIAFCLNDGYHAQAGDSGSHVRAYNKGCANCGLSYNNYIPFPTDFLSAQSLDNSLQVSPLQMRTLLLRTQFVKEKIWQSVRKYALKCQIFSQNRPCFDRSCCTETLILYKSYRGCQSETFDPIDVGKLILSVLTLLFYTAIYLCHRLFTKNTIFL